MIEFEIWFSQFITIDGTELICRESALKAWNCQQAKIDRLMLEFCPDEMLPEQIERWAESQRIAKVHSELCGLFRRDNINE